MATKSFITNRPPPNRRVVVTGGGGFVGGSIVEALAEKHPEWEITIVDVKRPAPNMVRSSKASASIDFIRADVRDAQEAVRAIEIARPQVVVHSAGVVPKGNDRYHSSLGEKAVAKLNIHGTENMLRAAAAFDVEAFVLTSSSQVIADDLNHDYPNFNERVPYPKTSLVYGASKAKAERMVIEANRSGFATCALRPSVILGREDYQLVPAIHACIAKNETPFIIGDGDNLYDFTFVDNVAHAHVLAVENLLSSKTAAGEAILISNGQPVTFRDFCLAVWAAFDHVPPLTIHVPVGLAWLIALLVELVTWITGAPQTLSRGSILDASGTRYCDQNKARAILGYEAPVDLWDGLKISCDSYKRRLQSNQVRR